jgi:hypothetical protein
LLVPLCDLWYIALMRQALLCVLLLCTSTQAAPLCPKLIEEFAVRPAVPEEFEADIWKRFGAAGKMPTFQPSEQHRLFLLSELPEQMAFFEKLDRSLAETGNIGLTKRQEDNLIMGILGSVMALTTAYTGHPLLAAVMGGGSLPLFYFSRQTRGERLELLTEVQSIGVFRENLQEQARTIEDRQPNTQFYLHKDFAGPNPFSLTVICRVDDQRNPSTVVLVKFLRDSDSQPYEDFH